ncbi:hypothetical protein [Methylocapsa sp. S129]|uniref:hypothetical protein n=1 Tax=Methylocapsa sp. S129 TaxID=1641869 RepID=UPI00131C6446|nr:hypothetical protein [Methylocapsa sp. S129]
MFTIQSIAIFLFTSLGAFLLWLRLKYGGNLFTQVDGIFNEIIDNFQYRMIPKMLFFVILGAILSIIIVGPKTYRQAVAAGAACTVMLGDLVPAETKRKTR